jgi:hypothetical protein
MAYSLLNKLNITQNPVDNLIYNQSIICKMGFQICAKPDSLTLLNNAIPYL